MVSTYNLSVYTYVPEVPITFIILSMVYIYVRSFNYVRTYTAETTIIVCHLTFVRLTGCLAAQKPFGLSKRTFTFVIVKILLILSHTSIVFKCKIKALVNYK